MPRPTFRPGLLALAIALAVPAPFLHAAPAEQASVRDYRIAAGPLAGTLNRIAAQAGLVLTLDPALAEGRSAHAVQGRFDAPGALREALKGSGLELVENVGGTYSLRKVPEDTLSLQAMTVSGAEEDPLGPTSGYVAKRSMTGTKTDTPILETPRSISVATRQQMTDRAVHNLDDAVRYMPGVVASSFGSDTRSDWLKVRGFKPTQFLDGLPMAVGVYNNPKLETWNLERVALLRGPASSVYGQTPPGGMLDMVSLRPQNVASHEVKAEVGNYNHKQVSFDSTGPLDDEGRFLYRVSGVVRDSNTQVDHIDDKRYNIAPSLTWNIDDDTRLTFLGQFNRDDTGITSQFLPLRGTKYDAPFGKVSHHKNLGDPDWEYYDRTYYWLGYAFEQRINDVWQFRQNLRYLRNDLSFQAVTAGTAHADGTLERSTTSVDEDVSQFVVEGRLRNRRPAPHPAARPGSQPHRQSIHINLWQRAAEQRQQPDLRPADRQTGSFDGLLRLQAEDLPDRPLRPGPDRPRQLAPDPRRSRGLGAHRGHLLQQGRRHQYQPRQEVQRQRGAQLHLRQWRGALHLLCGVVPTHHWRRYEQHQFAEADRRQAMGNRCEVPAGGLRLAVHRRGL